MTAAQMCMSQFSVLWPIPVLLFKQFIKLKVGIFSFFSHPSSFSLSDAWFAPGREGEDKCYETPTGT